MRFAKNKYGEKIEVSFSGEKAFCPDCNSVVSGRKGRIKIPYWTHPNNSDCDSWYEPITQWHIDWQNKFPIKYQEISQVDSLTGEIHRADIKLPNGLVIEIQNSPIKIEEIEKREEFYGQHNLIWIINGENLAKHSIISYQFEKRIFGISVEIPPYFEDCDYEMDEINVAFWSSDLIKKIRQYKSFKVSENQNGNYYWFEFSSNINLDNLIEDIQEVINEIVISLYGYECYIKIVKEIEIMKHFNPKDRYDNIKLEKRYWRKFIDLMRFPVLIDNLKGLERELLYWYQENKIVKKIDFINEIEKNKNWLQQSI